jgi:hypothetical protein
MSERRSVRNLEGEVVEIAPPPVLAGLVGADEGMVVVAVPVGGGVTVR